jgi:hypothetical protein
LSSTLNKAISAQLRVMASYTYLDARDSVTKWQRHKHQGYVRTEYSNAKWGLLANVRDTFFSKWWLNPAARHSRAFGYSTWDFYTSKNLPHHARPTSPSIISTSAETRKLLLAPPAFDRLTMAACSAWDSGGALECAE